MNAFTQAAAVLALKKMFAGNYFDICTIDTLIKATGVIVPREIYNGWRLLHCVHYSDMTPQVRSALMEQVVEQFKQPPSFDLNRLNEIAGAKLVPDHTASQAVTITIEPPRRKLLGFL